MLFIIKPYKFLFLFSIREGSCMLFIIKTLQVPLSALHIVRVRGWGFSFLKYYLWITANKRPSNSAPSQ